MPYDHFPWCHTHGKIDKGERCWLNAIVHESVLSALEMLSRDYDHTLNLHDARRKRKLKIIFFKNVGGVREKRKV